MKFSAKDRDPEAVTLFVNAKGQRAAVAANEDTARRQAAPKVRRAADPSKVLRRTESEQKDYDAAVDKANHHVENVISGQYPQYDKNRLGFKMYQKLSDKTYTNNSFIQAQTADIFSKMHVAVTEKTPTQEQMITLMARAVLLEAVKKEQALNNGGHGPIEQSMRDNPEEAISLMKNNETFKALTKDVSVDMLKHFFMTDAEVSMQETIANAEKRALENQADAKNAPEEVKQNPSIGIGG